MKQESKERKNAGRKGGKEKGREEGREGRKEKGREGGRKKRGKEGRKASLMSHNHKIVFNCICWLSYLFL